MSKIKTAILPVTSVLERALKLSKSATSDVVSYNEMTDEQLVLAVQKGEDQAFSYIVQRYQGKLFAYIMRLMNHRDEAHDITQDVFLKAYKNLHRFDTERKFSSWIYRIAHNESVNWLKKKTRVKIESLESQIENGYQPKAKASIESEYISQEEQVAVRKAINTLPKKYKQVMELRYLQQKSYEEIAEKLDKPINTVGTLINRAKKKMSAELEGLL